MSAFVITGLHYILNLNVLFWGRYGFFKFYFTSTFGLIPVNVSLLVKSLKRIAEALISFFIFLFSFLFISLLFL